MKLLVQRTRVQRERGGGNRGAKPAFPGGENGGKGRVRRAAVDGAQRLAAAAAIGRNEGVAALPFGGFKQRAEEGGGEPRHIASHHQVPFGGGMGQGGKQPAQRPLPGVKVWNYRGIQVRYCFGAANQGDVARRFPHLPGHLRHQGFPAPPQQSLVAAHPPALPASQHISRPVHREMIPSGIRAIPVDTRARRVHYTVRRNILMRYCSSLAAALLLTAGLNAAEAASSRVPAGAVKSVVRVDRRTGKLVRQVVPPPEALDGAKLALAKSFEPTVNRIAAEHALPPELVRSVILVESAYNPHAVSAKGAVGMMQLIPATARRFGVRDSFDAEENIRGGARYLRYLLDLYGGDSQLALAAYNAGEGAVARYGNVVPPFPETQDYVRQVHRLAEAGKPVPAPQTVPVAAPVAQAEEAAPVGGRPIRQIVTPDGRVLYVTP